MQDEIIKNSIKSIENKKIELLKKRLEDNNIEVDFDKEIIFPTGRFSSSKGYNETFNCQENKIYFEGRFLIAFIDKVSEPNISNENNSISITNDLYYY